MRPFTRRPAPAPDAVLVAADLPRGEAVLASGRAGDGTWLLGTRRRLVLVGDAEVVSLPWEEVEDAAWEREDSRLRITAIGTYAAPRPSWSFDLEDPDRLLQLVRERVTASVVLQRRVPVRDGRGLTVIGRRNPAGGPVAWMHAYDEGLDPEDPEVVVVADLALAQARAETGVASDPI
ncbi:MAG: hypothetical protein JWR42_1348 [Marmoricola sp.]|nr:hypothetical protein [Marmoricola sp.]